MREEQWEAARRSMVERQLAARDIVDRRVLDAMSRVPRHRFVPEMWRDEAYGDHPLPLSDGQTISQPYVVALMTQLARLTPQSRVLEIGVGSGYQTAILCELSGSVFGLEIVPALAESAESLLRKLGYRNFQVRVADGHHGWPEQAPFDAILAAAAPTCIPERLVEQLAPGGRLVLPVGEWRQRLLVLEKRSDGSLVEEDLGAVAFVPMVGHRRRTDA
ncbi:MAG: protein-L-isoaspartate(D-aspartate) O-methyltransferase [Planctomycetota bacterium]